MPDPHTTDTLRKTHRTQAIGILGGTFDPPHIGHLWMAASVRDALSLDEVWLMVAADPWQKSGTRAVTSSELRFELTRLACAGLDGVQASDVELARKGPTYTVETLERLASELGVIRPRLIVGDDTATRLTSWHRWTELPGLCDLIVTDRPGAERSELAMPHQRIQVDALGVSSTDIRNRVSRGVTIDVLCPAAVVSTITREGLYRGGDE